MPKRYWLLKSDPDTFGLEDLEASPDRTTMWDGVRNYQARNYLRDEMRVGDGVLFYHSQVQPPAVVATAKVVRAGYPDPTQFEGRGKARDQKSTLENPRWYAVDIRLDHVLPTSVSLPQMRETAGLEDMMLLRKGSRLSVQPVRPEEWRIVTRLGKRKPAKKS
jgi:predicted RNA-binding protein with PUA-like domain